MDKGEGVRAFGDVGVHVNFVRGCRTAKNVVALDAKPAGERK